MENRDYYIYRYICEQDVQYENEKGKIYIYSKGDTFYFGKGIKNRINQKHANRDCENIKSYGYKQEIVEENLTEQEAFIKEQEFISQYLKDGYSLTNKTKKCDKNFASSEDIATVKYILMLKSANVIRISDIDICLECNVYSGLINDIKNKKYENISAKVPDNIDYILQTYGTHHLSEDDIIIGNIKYCLNLIETGVLKMNQSDLAAYYGKIGTYISKIKSEEIGKNIYPIIPKNLLEMLKEFDPSKMTDKEELDGKLEYIFNLIDDGIVSMSIRDIETVLSKYYNREITYQTIQYFKRTNRNKVTPLPIENELLTKILSLYRVM